MSFRPKQAVKLCSVEAAMLEEDNYYVSWSWALKLGGPKNSSEKLHQLPENKVFKYCICTAMTRILSIGGFQGRHTIHVRRICKQVLSWHRSNLCSLNNLLICMKSMAFWNNSWLHMTTFFPQPLNNQYADNRAKRKNPVDKKKKNSAYFFLHA